nr:MAG TPA: hypothetical protein [Caudoviricetes sp.]
MKSNAKVMVQEDILKLIEQLKETEDEDITVVVGIAAKKGKDSKLIEMVSGNAGMCLRVDVSLISSVLEQLSEEEYESGFKQVLFGLIKKPHQSGNSDEA